MGRGTHVTTGRNNHSSMSNHYPGGHIRNSLKYHGNTRENRPGGYVAKITMTHTVLPVQEIDVKSGEIIVGKDFNGVIIVIPEFRISMMVGHQAITVISKMEKECGMVGIITITILGMITTTITFIEGSLFT